MARKELWDQVDENLYSVLGIPTSATPAQIQEAWRTAAKRTHPDLGGNPQDFHSAEIAYQVLSDPDLRLSYDQTVLPPKQMANDQRQFQANVGPFVPRSHWIRRDFGTTAPRRSAPQPAATDELEPLNIRWWLVALICVGVIAMVVVAYLLNVLLLVLFFGGAVAAIGMLITQKPRR